MAEFQRICISGESDGKKILKMPPAVVKWRIRMRLGVHDKIYLKYRNKIEERFLMVVDEDHVALATGANAINRTSPEPVKKDKRDFWKV